jgi:hypothetical protein
MELAVAALGLGLKPVRTGSPNARSTVRLVDFVAWAMGVDLELPEQFPRPRVTREVWERKAPDWGLWAPMAFVELIHAVALSCDIDPCGIVRPPCDDPEFLRRLKIANNRWEAGDIPHVAGPGSDVPGNLLRYVRFPDFAKLADSLGWSLPAEFPRIITGMASSPATWPWGKYNDGLLPHLEAAVNEFWKDYDPCVDDGKNRRKASVIKFLEDKGVSTTAARAIDTIARPKGWKSGPPKGRPFPKEKRGKK